jgi:hypothetical protein
MEKFEYKELMVEFWEEGVNRMDILNEFGEKGWELISSSKVDEHHIYYVFKRKKEKTLLM